MLREIKEVKQVKNEAFRRWFTDKSFDLIVWLEDTEISGFQLCYNKEDDEHAITWQKAGGFKHNKIDNGERPGLSNMTPILVPDGLFEKDHVARIFKEASAEIDKNIAEFVYSSPGAGARCR